MESVIIQGSSTPPTIEQGTTTSIDNSKKKFSCPLCPYKTNWKVYLNPHIRTHTGERPFKCPHPQCPYSAATSSALNIHQVVHTKEKNFTFSQCHKKFGLKSHLIERLRVHEAAKPFACSLCPYKAKRMQNLEIHVTQVHSKEKPFHCHICTFKSKTKSQLNLHLKRHTGEKSHQCPHCPYKFVRAYELKVHLRVHTGERPFPCHLCDYAATQSTLLHGHITRHHTNEKYFKCKWCEYSTVNNGPLVIHMRKHTGERPYKCPHCPWAFTANGSLRAHIHGKHGRKELFNCNHCLYQTANPRNWSRHSKRCSSPEELPSAQGADQRQVP